MKTYLSKIIHIGVIFSIMIAAAYAESDNKIYFSDGYRQVQLFSDSGDDASYLGELVKPSEPQCQDFFEYYDNFVNDPANVGQLLPETPAPPPGCLFGPRGIVLQNPGQLLVVNQNAGLDPFSGGVYRYNANTGKFLKTIVPVVHDPIPGPPSLYAPRGMVMSEDGKYVFVADYTSNTPDGEGQLVVYTKQGEYVTSLAPPAGTVYSGQYNPRSVVIGPDGLLYVSNMNTSTGLGGQVFRFDPENFGFVDVFINDAGGVGNLNRPEGLVFGPDGKLYIISYRGDATDLDSIRIYSNEGTYLNRINFYPTPNVNRAFAAALLFGPGGKLFVPMTVGPEGVVGEVRRYDVSDPSFPYDIYIQSGIMEAPAYFTFGRTNPATLAYE